MDILLLKYTDISCLEGEDLQTSFIYYLVSETVKWMMQYAIVLFLLCFHYSLNAGKFTSLSLYSSQSFL